MRGPNSWDNDTLRGGLVMWERPEDAHLRRKFGYWKMVQDRAAIELAACWGVTLDVFALGRIHEAAHRDDWTYREISAAVSARATKAPSSFNDEELVAIIERFAGANDEVGQTIHKKALDLLAYSWPNSGHQPTEG